MTTKFFLSMGFSAMMAAGLLGGCGAKVDGGQQSGAEKPPTPELILSCAEQGVHNCFNAGERKLCRNEKAELEIYFCPIEDPNGKTLEVPFGNVTSFGHYRPYQGPTIIAVAASTMDQRDLVWTDKTGNTGGTTLSAAWNIGNGYYIRSVFYVKPDTIATISTSDGSPLQIIWADHNNQITSDPGPGFVAFTRADGFAVTSCVSPCRF